jgi:hypothetical protein
VAFPMHIAPTHKAFDAYAATLAPTGWNIIAEQTMPSGIRPDGIVKDKYNLMRGYWEAKDTADDLDTEIAKKIAKGYCRCYRRRQCSRVSHAAQTGGNQGETWEAWEPKMKGKTRYGQLDVPLFWPLIHLRKTMELRMALISSEWRSVEPVANVSMTNCQSVPSTYRTAPV